MFDPSGQFELSICPNGRRPADEYFHQGSMWIEGRENSNYTIRFSNKTADRVLAIISVDGLDVLKGQPAGPQSEGYVVDSYSSIDIPGWKVDNNVAAEFFFAKSGKSYVTKMGANTSNTGVIGAMVFKEYKWNYDPLTYVTASSYPLAGGGGVLRGLHQNPVHQWHTGAALNAVGSNSVQTSATASSLSANVGTGFGEAVDWETKGTTFIRESQSTPNALMAIFYDDARNLQRRGIQINSKRSKYANNTNPFPTYTSGATPPPGWKG
jgi:hypothetical protein